MSERAVPVIVWATILFALILAVTVVPITPAEMCVRAGGEWNEAWMRCYGD